MLIRGTALISVLRAVEKLYGPGARAKLLASLPADDRRTFEATVLGMSQYPVSLQATLHKGVHDLFGGLKANEAVGRQAALDDFTGVYRVFLAIITFELLWANIERAWRRYNSRGKVAFTEHTPRSALCTISDVESYTEPMWYAIAGRVRGILELAGAKTVHARIDAQDATGARIELSWTK